MSRRIPYLVGNALGYDHLPGQIIPKSFMPTDISRYFYPKGLTLEQALAVLWRVKSWKITGSIGVIDSTNAAINGHFSANATTGFLDTDDTETDKEELSIINQSYDDFFYFRAKYLSTYANLVVEDNSIGSIEGAPDPFAICQFFINKSTWIFHDEDADLFYPEFDCEFGAVSNDDNLHFVWDPAPAEFDEDLTFGGPQSITVTMDSVILPPFTLFSALYWNRVSNALNFATGSITVRADKFWTYKNSLGQPVYDEDTGAQIHDPYA